MGKLRPQNILGTTENHERRASSRKSRTRRKHLEDTMEKGLKPHKYDNGKGSNDTDSVGTCRSTSKELSSSCGLFDKTQWERTRFSSEVAVDEKYFTEIFKQPLEPEESIRKRLVLLSESKQSTVVRGEYLNEKPKFTITLLSVEVVWCAACALVWAAAAVNPIVPLVTAALNMLIMFLLILSCLSIEVFRLQVQRDDTKSNTRFFIPYFWRYMICEVHVARAVLLCANITVMVFDDDFDIASIIVLAATPLQLILVAIHIFLSLKPKYQ